jgi:endonuclease/exonuclease/phosphatase (EEP) superfamily protein YafD|tara:strand:+ start:104 stop:814 length:711 start_codon:yes stop_codon:yes gene_type:complete
MTFNIGLSNDFNNLREHILLENPDIIQMQEVTPQTRTRLKSLEPFFPYNSGLDKPLNPFSSIIFSKYPLKNTKIIDFHTVITNVVLENREFTLVGAHISPPLDEFLGEIYMDMFFTYSKAKRTQKLSEANLGIAIDHMEFIKTLVDKTDKDLIVIGDLNMSAVSKRFNKFLKDTNLYTFISYKNFTSTWPTFLPQFLGIQIDHVLFSKHFKVIRKKANNNRISDHRALIVDLAYLK